MKTIRSAVMGLCLGIAISVVPPATFGESERGTGWVEGVILTERRVPAEAYAAGGGVGAKISIVPTKGGQGLFTHTDPTKGGFYTFRNLEPGVYEVYVDKSLAKTKSRQELTLHPQHIFGVIVEPDKRTLLNITVQTGDEIEEVGKPDVPTEPATVLVHELAYLKKENADLKKQMAKCKGANK